MNSCPGPEVKTYSYGTNLHRLIKDLFSKGYLDEDLDIQRHLLSEETDEDKKRLLEGTYNDIFMIFDLDPQDSNVDFEKIRKMLDFFDDSADDEKLYINYPMLESYKHMKSYDTKDFENSTVKMSDISKYKKIVNDECLLCLKHLRNYDEKVFRFIIGRHLSKTNLIINGQFSLPAISSFIRWKGIELFDIQRTKAENENAIFIVNTCVFCVVEYNPSSFLKIEK